MRSFFPVAVCLLFVMLFSAPSVWAQQASVSGVVTDESGLPLTGANVLLMQEGEIVTGTATDIEGRYSITGVPEGAYTVAVRFVGYESAELPLTLTAGASESIDVVLEESGINLDVVVVTASRRSEKVLDAPASISVLEARDITRDVAPTPTTSLRNTTGLDMAQTGIDRHEIVLRGFNNAFSGATYVLTDYRHAAVPSLGVNVYSLMPLLSNDVERVEVVRGPGSALYGPGVDAGVIHFFTKDPFTYPGTTVSITGGERSLFGGEFRHAGVVNDRVGYKFTGAYAQAEDWEVDPTDPANRSLLEQELVPRQNDYEKYTLNGLLQYRFNDRVTLSANAGFSRATATVLSGIGTVQADGFGYTYGQLRLQAGNFFSQLYVNRNDAGDSFNYGQAADPSCESACAPFAVVDNGVVVNAQAQYDWNLGQRHQVIVGTDLELTRPDTEGTILGRNEEDDSISEYGAYAQSTSDITDKLALTLALRADYNNIVEELQVSPRAAVVFKVTPQHTLRASYNRAFSSPGTNSLFLDIPARQVGPITVRGRGNAYGYTFAHNPAYDDLVGTDLVASSLNPAALGQDQPVGLSLEATYDAIYAQLASMSADQLRAVLPPQLQGLPDQLLVGVVQLLNPDLTQVSGFTNGQLILPSLSGGPTALLDPSEVADIEPLDQTITQTLEVGYKGLFSNRFLFEVDAYYTQKEDFIGPLALETPLVIVPGLQADLQAALAEGIANNTTLAGALQQFNLTPEQVAAMIVGLAADQLPDPSTPIAIVQPVENNAGAGQMPELMLTYRNFGNVQYWGLDASFQLIATSRLNLFGNVSFVSDNFFDSEELDEEGTGLELSLNAPKFKGKTGFSYTIPQGFSFNASGRYVDEFEVRSGPYEGKVDSYFLLDAGAGYDFSRYAPGLRLDVTVLNVLDNVHREFIGAPELGRMAMARLTYNF